MGKNPPQGENHQTNTNDNVNDAQTKHFVHLLTANQHRIYAYILSVLANSSDADDVMQEATTVMLRKFGEFQPGTDFVAWGMTIAHYSILSFKNKQKRTVRLSDEAIKTIETDAGEVLKKSDFRMDSLKQCILKLVMRDRQLIKMRYYHEFSIKSIAERVGMNIRSIYRDFARIHEALLRCIQRKLAGGDI
ncbi:MAG: sigma-70 family RNA polymerase sigma factor [Deltaproteobacteria bacterium]|nr:sigma-70 family RNA polymerase sigma factor [Deltaproteobacteria bacterium]